MSKFGAGTSLPNLKQAYGITKISAKTAKAAIKTKECSSGNNQGSNRWFFNEVAYVNIGPGKAR